MPQKGFFASLLDVSFSSLISTTIIKVLYVLSLVVLSLGALAFAISGFTVSAGRGVAFLVLAAIGWLVYAIYIRVLLEVLIAVFRIMETNVGILEELRGRSGVPPTAPGRGPEAPRGL